MSADQVIEQAHRSAGGIWRSGAHGAAVALQVLDALKAAGYTVVELPKPDPDTGPFFDAGNGAIAHVDDQKVRLHSVVWTEGRHGGTWLAPAQARSLAAALLAAADAAEAIR